VADELSVPSDEKRHHFQSRAPLISPSQVFLVWDLDLTPLKDKSVDLLQSTMRNHVPTLIRWNDFMAALERSEQGTRAPNNIRMTGHPTGATSGACGALLGPAPFDNQCFVFRPRTASSNRRVALRKAAHRRMSKHANPCVLRSPVHNASRRSSNFK
jgi:hypothetical protein